MTEGDFEFQAPANTSIESYFVSFAHGTATFGLDLIRDGLKGKYAVGST